MVVEDPASILGPNPLVAEIFKVLVDYDYQLVKQTSISTKQSADGSAGAQDTAPTAPKVSGQTDASTTGTPSTRADDSSDINTVTSTTT